MLILLFDKLSARLSSCRDGCCNNLLIEVYAQLGVGSSRSDGDWFLGLSDCKTSLGCVTNLPC